MDCVLKLFALPHIRIKILLFIFGSRCFLCDLRYCRCFLGSLFGFSCLDCALLLSFLDYAMAVLVSRSVYTFSIILKDNF